MNRFDKFALGTAILVTVLCARQMVWISQFHMERLQLSGTLISIGVMGWLAATYGPMALAALFLRLTKRAGATWLLHILFLPCALALLRLGGSMMLYVMQQPDFDAMLGGPAVPGFIMFLAAAGGYFVALISRQIPNRRKIG